MSKHVRIFAVKTLSNTAKKHFFLKRTFKYIKRMRYETKNIDCHLYNLVFKPLNKSTVGISNLQLKMSVNTGIGKVNNKVISQAPESVSQVAKAQSERVHAG